VQNGKGLSKGILSKFTGQPFFISWGAYACLNGFRLSPFCHCGFAKKARFLFKDKMTFGSAGALACPSSAVNKAGVFIKPFAEIFYFDFAINR